VRLKEAISVILILLCAALAIPATIDTLASGQKEAGAIHSSSSPIAIDLDQEQAFGAESNPTGSPIGGGDGYRDRVAPTDPGVDTIVMTADELLAALRSAQEGDIIYIDETAGINLTDAPGSVTIPGGVTLAGNRGERSVTGTATYPFEIDEPGEYVLWVRASAGDEGRDAIWVSVDEEEIRRWDLEVDRAWRWSRAGARYLPAGEHILNIHWREGGLNLDEIFITGNPDRLPGVTADEAAGESEIRMEAESGVLSPGLEETGDLAASGGAYVSAPDNPSEGEYPLSEGGLIYLDQADPDHRIGFVTGGEGVRITGLRLEGPHSGIETVDPTVIGIYSAYRNLEVDNCEIRGWSGAAVGVTGTGGSEMKTGGYIHHNYIHHCQAEGFGYGVVVSAGAVALIEANYFDYCRHAIAGSGVAGDGYEAQYNICGPNFIAGSSHNFDMHGVASGTGMIAGDTIRIHHNTFTATGPLNAFPVAIRGVPRDGAYIHNNWFYYTQAPPVWQTGGQGRVFVTENLIGENKTFSASGPIEYY